MSADKLREAARQIRVDVKVAVDRGHMTDRGGRYNRAVADLLDAVAVDFGTPGHRHWHGPEREAVKAAEAYLS